MFKRLLEKGHGTGVGCFFLRLRLLAVGDDDDGDFSGRVQPVEPFHSTVTCGHPGNASGVVGMASDVTDAAMPSGGEVSASGGETTDPLSGSRTFPAS